ncbi:MAG: NAD-dependent malic enzyme [Nanoarchaeota archaeon]|jgi:malate dehydrogenase (oxaloacetate-decarboxylating)|nr:NAD-dependent malic enzyme [Nanoarchaeota archaeon]|tara:strand:+ start:8175 stop:9317 length:1143 start_codon:yes stop_codon:yes gene_type:complete
MNYNEEALKLHEENKGKVAISSKVKIETKDDLSTAYTPGVAEPCRKIYGNPEDVYKYTFKSKTVAVVTDGSAVLGLGDIGPEAALPVMEGKAVLFKRFADIDAFPICLKTNNVDEIVSIIKSIEPGFGGINLEDISAPRCFEIEDRLKEEMNIPVMHDDQHGTAVVVLAGLINACKLTNKNIKETKVVISGAGAAGIAVAKILLNYDVKNLVLCDSKGIVSKNRNDLNEPKKEILTLTNPENISGSLKDALKDRDVFIGVSVKDIINTEDIKTMKDPIVFAMSNPDPEIIPDNAKAGGAKVIATGRSDFPNQINNVLAFPGIFKGALESGAKKITDEMKIAAAEALANHVKDLSPEKIIPNAFEDSVADVIAEAIKSNTH